MMLLKIRAITATIRLESGLHIGAGKDSVEIGGLDQPIIKNPLTSAPYIPGSSIKGKMRSLLETLIMGDRPETRAYVAEGKPCACGKKACPICTLFGAHAPADKCEDGLGPTRALFRDANLDDTCRELLERGQLPMEIKYENTIDRVRGCADNPRPLERVPAGVRFSLNIALKVFEGDDPDLVNWIFRGLKLVQEDALGGCSSRGCGQVRFENLKLDGEDVNLDDVSLS